jgi:integrase
MSDQHATPRRSYGAGRLYTRTYADSSKAWYGIWWAGARRVKRKLGPTRSPGSRDGLTRAQAETELRRMMAAVSASAIVGERITIEELADRYRRQLEAAGRKPSTTRSVESACRVWICPAIGDRPVDGVKPEDVEDLIRTMRKGELSAKSIHNYIGTLGAMYRYAMHPRRRWASTNPVVAVELPPWERSDEIRFLTVDDVHALAAAAVPGAFEQIDRTLFLLAAMTGLRLGELRALRWRDIDWTAQRIRVRRNYVRGAYGTPKSRRSSRSVPLADEPAGALERLFQRSRFQESDDLVFCEPDTGEPLRDRALIRRYRRALKAAGLDTAHRFHDLRHTFGTAMAAEGVPMRTVQEWMGHRHLSTTQIYADYAPSPHEAAMVARAFDRGSVSGSVLSESQLTSDHLSPSTKPSVSER